MSDSESESSSDYSSEEEKWGDSHLYDDDDDDDHNFNDVKTLKLKMNGCNHDEAQALSEEMHQYFHKHMKQCEVCEKSYDLKMIITEHPGWQQICYHCLLHLCFTLDQRSLVDGTVGWTIVEYIINCREYHDEKTCIHPDECFLCLNLKGIHIDGILNGEILTDLEVERPKEVKQYEVPKFTVCI